jgi:hypothetical protein
VAGRAAVAVTATTSGLMQTLLLMPPRQRLLTLCSMHLLLLMQLT